MKPSKSVIKSEIIEEWDFPHYQAVKLYEAGWVRACDICGKLFLHEDVRNSDKYLKDICTNIDGTSNDEMLGASKEGLDLCYEECWRASKESTVRKARTASKAPQADAKDPKACPFCQGEAKLACKPCDGSGWIGCPACDAAGGALCASCDGWKDLQTECDRCKATGKEPNFRGLLFDKNCKECYGTKTKSKTCYNCKGEGRTDECRKCDGIGEVDCPNCSGNGQLPCPECKGYGRPIPKSVV
jgi:hypothetical protein